ncbi:MAG: tryptophan synthase subunit alpha [Cytophagales bacterium]|nr:tryptophan synthase subunit alpha [Cytophagales bacterium]
MQNRINTLFQNKKKDILNVYFTAGYPKLDDTKTIIQALDKAGADLIEIGIPYSDPVADGPTIQASNQVALSNGITLEKIFEQLQDVREYTQIPIVLMGYFNPVFQYGVERFCGKCKEIGLDGLIVPDLPLAEYVDEYQEAFEANSLHNIFLISPQTSEKRIRLIDEHSSGFLYMVSSASVTGAKTGIEDAQVAYFERVNAMDLQTPRLIGFGISNRETFKEACQHANGAIIGSAFVNVLANNEENLEEAIGDFVRKIKGK